MQKTNAMRLLDKAKISYTAIEYTVDESDLSGVHVAQQIGRPAGQVFKTLVLKGAKNGHLVCCLPSDAEIDLKKAAAAAGEKKVELIAVKDLQHITGYLRGGCSPVGMKKRFATYIDRAAGDMDEIVVSAGVRGGQIALNPQDLLAATGGSLADLAAGQE